MPHSLSELQIESAEKFLKEIKKYLENKLDIFSDK